MTSGDRIKDLLLLYRSIEFQYQLSQYTDESLLAIQKALNIAREELLAEIDVRDFRLPPGREDMVLEELNDLTFGIQSQLTGNITEAATVAGEASYREYGQILSFDGKLAETVGFDFVSLSPAQLKAMVETVPVGGKLLNEWVTDTFKGHIVDDIKTAIMADNLKGASTPQIINRLRDAFGLIERDAETLVRTYLADINNTAAEAVYKANSDIIKYESWNATLEVSRHGGGTCLRCASCDGRRYKIDEPHIRPPLHPNCRCFMLPETVSYRELGLDVDEMKRSLRPYTERGEKRAIIQAGQFDGDFEKYLWSRGKGYQIDLLGPNRYRLIQEGKIEFQDLVDKDGNVVLLKRGQGGGYTGLEPSQKHLGPKSKPAKPKIKSFTPAKSIQETLTDLPATRTPSGVTLDGITKKQEASILAGLNDSVVQYGGKLNSVGWQTRRRRSLGVAARSGDYIQFQKTGTKKIHKDAARQRDVFLRGRDRNIEKTKAAIKDPRRSGIVDYNRDKLKKLENSKMWASYTEAKDPLRAIAGHEGFHNVYFTHKLEEPFEENLKKHGVTNYADWFKVSEYGASNIAELFAETGAAIANKIDIPSGFRKAFEDTVRKHKK